MTSSDDSTWTPQLAIFGDLGNENAISLPHLQEEVQRGMYDAILHVGDFAYDMDSVSAGYLVSEQYNCALPSVAICSWLKIKLIFYIRSIKLNKVEYVSDCKMV
jgi:hypothetical protein